MAKVYFEVKMTGGFTCEFEDGESPEEFLLNLSDADVADFVQDNYSINSVEVICEV